jgi:PAS domain S-box-containing protein
MIKTPVKILFKSGGYQPFLEHAENRGDFFNRHTQQLLSFFRLLPHPTMVLDHSGTAVMVNEPFLALYEISSEKVFCGVYNIFKDPFGQTAGAGDALTRIFKGETAFIPCATGLGYSNFSPAGIKRKTDIHSSAIFIPVLGSDAKTAYVISIWPDISEQKRTEERLRSSEETFRSMIHAIQEAALLISTSGDVFAANATVAGRLGETTESIIGKNIYDLLPPEEAVERRDTIAQVISTGNPVIGEIQREDRILISSVNPVFNQGKKVERVAIFATDITRLKKAQKQIFASEERMRALLEGSSDMVQVLDEKGTIHYVSPSMERILGYDPRLPLGDSAFKIVHPDDLPLLQIKFAELFKNPEKPLKVICRVRHKNGSWRHIEAWAKNHLANPAINGIVLNIRDITEHIEAKVQLEASEERFRSIVEQSRDGITIIDNKGTILIFNKAQERISGIPGHEAIGKKIWEIQYRCMARPNQANMPLKKFKARYLSFLRTGKGPWLESICTVEMIRPDGERIHLQTLLFPLKINNTLAYASFNRDVTQQRAADMELQKSQIVLAEQNKLLQQKNMALRELMSQVEVEKKKTRELIQANIDQLVLPVLSRLKARCCDADRVYVDILEENLREITIGFGLELSRKMHHLTQKEIELCSMIKQGLTSKEIGALLNISPRTVETHRTHIRKKLGIAGPEVNMTTYLKSEMQQLSLSDSIHA